MARLERADPLRVAPPVGLGRRSSVAAGRAHAGIVAGPRRFCHDAGVPFETVEHTGDLAVRLEASGLAGLIEEGVCALGSLLFEGEPPPEAPREERRVHARGVDREDVLVQALSEALHVLQDEDLRPVAVSAEVVPAEGGAELAVSLHLAGVRADGRRLRRSEEIKAVTYHGVEIAACERGLRTTVVFDV